MSEDLGELISRIPLILQFINLKFFTLVVSSSVVQYQGGI